jgi:hypothetical protein
VGRLSGYDEIPPRSNIGPRSSLEVRVKHEAKILPSHAVPRFRKLPQTGDDGRTRTLGAVLGLGELGDVISPAGGERPVGDCACGRELNPDLVRPLLVLPLALPEKPAR